MSKAPPAEVSRLGICDDSTDFAEFRVALAIETPGHLRIMMPAAWNRMPVSCQWVES
jgi:hypothetical protein